MKNINVLIGLKRISEYKEQGNKKAPNPASIKAAETFINQTSAPMEMVKVGLNPNTGNPVLYFKRDFEGRNVCSVEVSEATYFVKFNNTSTEANSIQEATNAVIHAYAEHVEQQESPRSVRKPLTLKIEFEVKMTTLGKVTISGNKYIEPGYIAAYAVNNKTPVYVGRPSLMPRSVDPHVKLIEMNEGDLEYYSNVFVNTSEFKSLIGFPIVVSVKGEKNARTNSFRGRSSRNRKN